MDKNQFSRQNNNKSLAAVLKEKGLVSSITEAEEMAKNINETNKKVTQTVNNYKAQIDSPSFTTEQILKKFGLQLGEQIQILNTRINAIENNMSKVVSQLNLVVETMNTYFNQQPIIQQTQQIPEPQVQQEAQTPVYVQQAPQQVQASPPVNTQFQATSAPEPKEKTGRDAMKSEDYDIMKFFYSGSKPK